MTVHRASGILLHPSSLPGPGGHGDLGPSAHRFVDWLVAAGQRVWQVLPLAPPAAGNSPYSALSVLAGNPLLVSPQRLVEAGYLDAVATQDALDAFDAAGEGEAGEAPAGAGAAGESSPPRIDFDRAAHLRMGLLRLAFACWRDTGGTAAGQRAQSARGTDDPEFIAWCERNASWAFDYALFMALASSGLTPCWRDWPAGLRRREADSLESARRLHAGEVQFWLFVQWQFDQQWLALREHANRLGVAIIGDMPIYCALDSADVWQHQPLFQLDEAGRARRVAGVPPDYFSADGQLWGNPLYDWRAHAADGFRWWRARFARALVHADIVRIDHFRGLAAYWSVAADAHTAVHGVWEPGPGIALFDAMLAGSAGTLPIIAEDLGTITPDVTALRDAVGLPGMSVLQFAFGDTDDNPYLPRNIGPQTIVYTGTHDNDTTVGWFDSASASVLASVRRHLAPDEGGIQWALIRAASASAARLAIYPMQDVLGLPNEARMNLPGAAAGQWGWRFAWQQVQPWQAQRLAAIARADGRLPFDGNDQGPGARDEPAPALRHKP